MMKTIIKLMSGLFFLGAIAGAIYQYYGTQLDEKKYQPVGKMIDIGGYKLHMIDSHIGDVTVVIDSGAGGKTLDWCLVQPEIAKFARVITYDRAGYTWSDASPLARTSDNIVQELHTMLQNAQVPAPYVLVGHSFGGLNMRLFANKYPDEVAGVILVDAAHEDLFERLPQLRSNKLMLYAVLAANYCGIFRIMSHFASTQRRMYEAIAKYPVFLQRMYTPLTLTTKFVNAMTQESLHLEKSCNQLKLENNLLGDKPLTVISSGKQLTYEQVDGYMLPAQVDAYNYAWAELQADLVTKSTQGKQIIAKNSGHVISTDQPQIIVDAVREMIKELKIGKE